MIQKSYDYNEVGKLFLVPTPIGNMNDITLRAIEVLAQADYIYAEDTRVAINLLKKIQVSKQVKSCHKYSEEKNKVEIVTKLKSGFNVAYISDRGTPLISDPGQVVVKYAIDNNIDVISLPGPSALLPALNMSGLDNARFMFYGFLNSKYSKRIEELKNILNIPYTIIFYEAPHRITDTLIDMKSVFGNRNVAICREISKLYEEIFRGSVSDAIKYSKTIKGEIVIVLEGADLSLKDEKIDYIEKVENLILSGHKISFAVREIAMLYGISKNKLYDEYISKKGK